MSILIKGAEMPKSCIECLTTLGLFSKTCPISDDSNIDIEFAKNHIYDGCPLVEIPPYSKLIDANMVYQELLPYSNRFRKSVLKVIENIPTVIESEGE